jgi:hypothetical protein
MPGEANHGMQCAEFDLLLMEALDGTLVGPDMERFQAHANLCSTCGPLFAEIDAGKRLLKSLAEVEPPAHLVNNILAATCGLDTTRMRAPAAAVKPSWAERVREWIEPVFAPIYATVRQPRFAMSFGMAFFSISMALNLVGVKLTDIRHVDLRPSAIVRGYHMTSGRVVKYYENIRFVYQIESKVREFKRVTTPAEPAPNENQRRRDNNNTSGQPDQRQERNYSQGENQPVLASAPDDPPVVTGTTTRRFA